MAINKASRSARAREASKRVSHRCPPRALLAISFGGTRHGRPALNLRPLRGAARPEAPLQPRRSSGSPALWVPSSGRFATGQPLRPESTAHWKTPCGEPLHFPLFGCSPCSVGGGLSRARSGAREEGGGPGGGRAGGKAEEGAPEAPRPRRCRRLGRLNRLERGAGQHLLDSLGRVHSPEPAPYQTEPPRQWPTSSTLGWAGMAPAFSLGWRLPQHVHSNVGASRTRTPRISMSATYLMTEVLRSLPICTAERHRECAGGWRGMREYWSTAN